MNIDFARCEFGQEERDAVNQVLKTNWLASGEENLAFEKEFAKYVGTKFAVCVNSGSSANLLALASLELPKSSRVISSACGFPATLSPILHLDLEPVLVDYDLKTHNANIDEIIAKLPEVQAMILAHTLGNPLDMERIMAEANKLGVPVIEDCCEAVGSLYRGKQVGSWGTLGTFSFYPAHQMTAEGMGGMITTDDYDLAMRCRSMRDWGKVWDWDTKIGNNVTCYNSIVDGIPYYKHYTYETVGFNMKLSETAAAFGREQIKRLDGHRLKRIINFEYLTRQLEELDLFHLVKHLPDTEPSWFGFPLTLRRQSLRESLGDFLEASGVRTRPFFAGNITRHKPFYHLKQDFEVADKLMRDTVFIGIGQWMDKEQLDYVVETIKKWLDLQSPYSITPEETSFDAA